MDIEDAHKLRNISTKEKKELFMAYLTEQQRERACHIFECVTDTNEQIAYLRSTIIGVLVRECTNTFCEHEQVILKGKFQKGLMEHLPAPIKEAYISCQQMAIARIYNSKEVLDIELAGYKIIRTLLDCYIEAILSPDKSYSQLLINRVSSQYNIKSPLLNERIHAVLDFISGMTDVYALDLYRKINGHSLPTI